MQLLSQAEYARHLESRYRKKISRQGIHKIYGSVIPARADKRVDVAAADAAMIHRGLITLDNFNAGQAAPDDELPLTDPAPRGDGKPRQQGTSSTTGYYAQKTEREEVETEIKKIELAKLRGEMLFTRDVAAAMADAGVSITNLLNGLPSWADELLAVALSDGVAGLRVALRQKNQELRGKIAEALRLKLAESGEGGGDES